MWSLQLLGPLLLRDARGPVKLTVRKVQALIAWLALEGPTTRERLCQALWPALDESAARRNLRRELMRLRETGGDGLLLADGDRLSLAPGVELDTARFEAAQAAGRDDDALACWRGPPADGLQLDDAPPFEEMLALARERWRRAWRRSGERAAQAREDAGDVERALGLLQELLADDPLHERHHAAAMRLLARAGRREEALQQFERCRQLLADELGLEPLRETVALAESLRGPPLQAPAPPAPPAAPPPPASAAAVAGARVELVEPLPFVGRAAESARLEAAWRAGGTVLVGGEGGVGKTRLVLDLAAAQGAVAWVRARGGDGDVPYATFGRALRVLAGESPAQVAWPEWVRDELARLLPELGPAARPMASAEDRARFHDACTHAWRQLADDSFDGIVIDDWHLADGASQALLAFVIQRRHEEGARGARELLTWRPAETSPGAAALLDTLAALPRSARVQLEPWSESELTELVRVLSQVDAPTRFVHRLFQATNGHPFFVAETLRHWSACDLLTRDERGRWHTPFDERTDDYRELPLPASVREQVVARVELLPDGVQRLLHAASQAGEPFDVPLLAASCALSELEATAALERALAARFVREIEPGQWGFAHDLVQQAIGQHLGADRQRLLHRRLALGGEQTGAEPALIARHFEAGADRSRAVRWRIAAAQRAMQLAADTEARPHWQAALDDGPSPAEALAIHAGLLRLAMRQGDSDAARAAIEALAGLLDRGGLDGDRPAEASLAIAEAQTQLGAAPTALAGVEALLQALPPGHALRARAESIRCDALSALGRLAEAQTAGEAALAAAPPPALWAEVMDSLVLVAFRAGRIHDGLELARRAVERLRSQGERRALARALERLGVMLYMNDRREEGERALQRAYDEAGALHQVELQRAIAKNLSKIHGDRGDHAAAAAVLRHAWELSPTFARPELRVRLMSSISNELSCQGDLGAALDWAEGALVAAEALGESRPLLTSVGQLASVRLYACDLDGALAVLERHHNLRDSELGPVRVKASVTRAMCRLANRDTAGARQVLSALGDPAALEDGEDRAEVALATAALALSEGRPDAADAALEPWAECWPTALQKAMGMTLGLRARPTARRAAAARAALDEGRFPAPETLELLDALAAVDPVADEPLRTLARRVHDSLATRPLTAQAFARRWLG